MVFVSPWMRGVLQGDPWSGSLVHNTFAQLPDQMPSQPRSPLKSPTSPCGEQLVPTEQNFKLWTIRSLEKVSTGHWFFELVHRFEVRKNSFRGPIYRSKSTSVLKVCFNLDKSDPKRPIFRKKSKTSWCCHQWSRNKWGLLINWC